MLNDATVGLAGHETAIGDAIALTIKHLQDYPTAGGRILILLTDGMNNAGVSVPLEAAAQAAKEGIRIYTIGLGSSRVVLQGL